MKTLIAGSNGMASVMPASGGGVRDWQRWAPYAAVAWSLAYAALGITWAVSRRGFPYATGLVSGFNTGPLVGRFGPGAAWIFVMMAGVPAVAVGAAMPLGVRGRLLRPLLITTGALLAGVLLLFMIEFTLLLFIFLVIFILKNSYFSFAIYLHSCLRTLQSLFLMKPTNHGIRRNLKWSLHNRASLLATNTRIPSFFQVRI